MLRSGVVCRAREGAPSTRPPCPCVEPMRVRLTVCRLERHALGSEAPHQPGNEQLQVQRPGHGHVGQAVGGDGELVAPLVVTAVRVKEELQPGPSLEGHFLETSTKAMRSNALEKTPFRITHVLQD